MVKQITNKRAGRCSGCGTNVQAGAGVAQLEAPGQPWIVKCIPCRDGVVPTVTEPVVTPKPTFPLTEEQKVVVAKFGQGHSLAVQAGAGTGKTSTLVAISNSTTRLGTFVAFNKAIVQDAGAKLPKNVSASTAHSLAFRQVGKKYRHRLDADRQSSTQIARQLGLDPFVIQFGQQTKVLQPSRLAGYVMKGIEAFCNSADKHPTGRHIPYIDGIDLADAAGSRTFTNNDRLRDHLSDAIDTAWADIVSLEGTLRFNPDHFLKIWELGIHGAPVIPGDFILFDEAQDASPVLLSVVEQQAKQVVFVGDAQQAIYEWRGAVDAMSTVPADATAYLTNSFRFGPEIAGVANMVLSRIDGAVLRLTGRGKPGAVEAVTNPDAILTRTNAGAIREVLAVLEQGRQPFLVGGGGETERFAKAAKALMEGRTTEHPELCIFDSWGQVQEYVAQDALGSDLAPMVKLIDDHGVDTILRAAGNKVDEQDADVVISTAHKSKGREWDTVTLAGDFPEGDRQNVSELRLLYVAVTRARLTLDVTGCAAASDIIDEEGEQPVIGSPVAQVAPIRRLPSEVA